MLGWLVTAREEVPHDDGWLLPFEREVLHRLHVIKRREDWRHGRWTAKRALDRAWRQTSSDPAPSFGIRAADDGAPEAFDENGAPAPFAISISHSGGLAACAVGTEPSARMGCDLELIEPRSDELIAQFFTEAEQRRIREAAASDRALIACLTWSAKESALKALRTGLREDTRSIEVEWDALGPGWQRLRVTGRCDLSGWCRVLGLTGKAWVLTLVADSRWGEPVELR